MVLMSCCVVPLLPCARVLLRNGREVMQRLVVRVLPHRPSLAVAGLALGATLAAAATPPRVEAAQKMGSLVVQVTCFYFPLYTEYPCPRDYAIYDIKVYPDWGGFGPFNLSKFTYSFNYDPALLTFRADRTSLVCDLRSAAVPASCPTLPPGQGTTALGSSSDAVLVDQTGLTISEDPSGLPSVTLSYTSPTPISIPLGERIFLALSFDPRIPLAPGATVTYSPLLLSRATFAATGFSCTDDLGTELPCSSSHPSLSLRLNPAVPGPLAVAALPAMLHASRRLRRRVRGTVA